MFSQDYSQSEVIALDSEGDSEGTGRLVSVHHVDSFIDQDVFVLRVVGDEVGKGDIGVFEDKGRKVVCFDTLDILDAVVVGRVAVGYHDHLSHPLLEDLAHLEDMHFHSTQTRVEEVTHQGHRDIFLHPTLDLLKY